MGTPSKDWGTCQTPGCDRPVASPHVHYCHECLARAWAATNALLNAPDTTPSTDAGARHGQAWIMRARGLAYPPQDKP